ncbi:hypothetical protein PN441_14055 [Spirulina major CS-329]|uniref:WD40 domain-containing protein n=1 Tax=Spirulina TaxID=1154 RepID=UPI00232DD551|nr:MULTISPECIES: hypothetical protein [Spirulina]MDB9496691.1 hypothetical protein [Spirulina subsalsa CS-330]MDB9504196.1 hypothetical protein [Spirulina major CS-329]
MAFRQQNQGQPLIAEQGAIAVPQPTDAVLGQTIAAPDHGLVLGGIPALEHRLHDPDPHQRRQAVTAAMYYGGDRPLTPQDPGVALVIRALLDESSVVQRTAYRLLRDQPNPKIQRLLGTFLPYALFDCLCRIPVGAAPSLSPTGQAIAYQRGHHVIVQELATRRILLKIPRLDHHPERYALGNQGQLLVRLIDGEHNRLEVWQGGELTQQLYSHHHHRIRCLALAPAAPYLVTGTVTGQLQRWDLRSGTVQQTTNPQGPSSRRQGAIALTVSSDARLIVSSHRNHTVQLWYPQHRRRPAVLPCHATTLALSPDRHILATAHWANEITLWNLRQNAPLGRLRSLSIGRADQLVFSPSGRILASSDRTGTIRFWDIYQGDCLHTLHTQDSPITQLIFAAQGHALLSCHGDQHIRLWAVP